MGNTAFQHQTPQIAVCADIVEPMVVDSDVRHVRSHLPHGLAATDFEKPLIIGAVKLEQCRADLKPLSPFRPTLRRVFPANRQHGRTLVGPHGSFDREDLVGRQFPHVSDVVGERLRLQPVVDVDHCVSISR